MLVHWIDCDWSGYLTWRYEPHNHVTLKRKSGTGPFLGSKNPPFQNEAKCKTFAVKMNLFA